QAPESDPVTVLVPSPVGDVGHGRTASGRSKDGARHGLANVPFFHVDDHPNGEALALRQCEARALGNGRENQALARQQLDVNLSESAFISCLGIAFGQAGGKRCEASKVAYCCKLASAWLGPAIAFEPPMSHVWIAATAALPSTADERRTERSPNPWAVLAR